ncbi:MAG: hypothetical protein JXJ22_16700, partial [Bacteroidales bacterium]|nr:hypothetical protein [Bacteroidales bacterium]
MSGRILILATVVFVFTEYTVYSQELTITEPVRFLALGDSYTIGASVSPSVRWPKQLFDSLTARGYQTESFEIIAQTGWRTDDLEQAIEYANLTENYNLVSLLIGVNNQYQGYSVDTYKPGFEDLLKKAVALAGGKTTRVFVLSIPDYAYTP